MKCLRVLVLGALVLALAPTVDAGKKKTLRPIPPEDSPLRQTAAKYNFSMNMLLFPDYFMTEEQFQDMEKNNFKDCNVQALVRGLNAYGFRTTMPKSASEYRDKVYPNLLRFLKKAGFVVVEIPVNTGTVPLCKQLRKEIERQQLRVTAVGGSGEDLEASLKPKIDCTHALGARLLAGPVVLEFKKYPENKIGDARVAWAKKRLKELREPMRRVAEYAKSKDVRLAVEPLNRFELPGLNRLADAIAFVRAVDHPNFGVMIDTCHEMSDGEGPFKFARQVKTLMQMNKLYHVHISSIHRGRIDQAWINWYGFFRPLIKNGYQGNMSMEIFDATLPFSEAVHINRRRFANPPEVVLAALIASAKRLEQIEQKAK